MTEERRRWSVATVVFCGHLLIVMLIDQLMREEPAGVAEMRRPILFFVRSQQRSLPLRAPPSIQPNSSREAHEPLASPPTLPAFGETVAPTAPQPKIDWIGEATRAANDAVSAQQAADALKFSEASKAPHKKCTRPRPPEWRAQPSQYGFAGGLPFVRFNDDRCIFLLVFIGCGFGAKPQAESHLFDNMHNYPNDSSVPDLDECEEAQ